FLPDMLGWRVLGELKQDAQMRHIPVQILTLDEDRQNGLARGAFAFITKPTSAGGLEKAIGRIREYAEPRRRRLLVVEDNATEQLSIGQLLGHDDIDVEFAGTGRTALDMLMAGGFDCVVLDLRLPDITGFEVLDEIARAESLRDLP